VGEDSGRARRHGGAAAQLARGSRWLRRPKKNGTAKDMASDMSCMANPSALIAARRFTRENAGALGLSRIQEYCGAYSNCNPYKYGDLKNIL